MKKSVIVLSILLTSCTSQQFQDTVGVASQALGGTETSSALNNEDVIGGLKEALKVGTKKSVVSTSVTDGFWKNELIKIAFPEDAIKVKNTLNDLGMSNLVQNFEMTLNRAAEEASKEAVPVFLDAITGMSIGDGFAILKGGEGAATGFLKEKTTTQLTQKFSPVVEQATSKVELAKAWEPLASAYNTATIFTGGKAIDTDLNMYVTNKAIDGLFKMIAQEENKIRKDPLARTSDLLKKVFSQQY